MLKHCNHLKYFFIKSHEKGLITNEHIVAHTHLNFVFEWALHFSTLVIKLLHNTGTSYCYCNIKNQYLLHHRYDTFTFKTEVLCLVSNVQHLKCLLLLY